MSYLKEAYALPNNNIITGDKTTTTTPNEVKNYKNKDFFALPINQSYATGDFHVNHFVCFFEMTSGFDFFKETQKLFSSFPTYFNNDLFKVEIDDKKWRSNKIATFDVSLSPIDPHVELVTIHHYGKSKDTVVGTTLFDNREEGFIAKYAPLLVLPTRKSIKEVVKLKFLNRFHFLSGRRSWKFGKVEPSNDDSYLYYFETAALERFSLPLWNALNQSKNPPLIRTLVNNTWLAMLKNFSEIGKIDLVNVYKNEKNPVYPFDGMDNYNKDVRKISDKQGVVYYRNGSSKTLNGIFDDESWFTDVQDRHPSLYLDNMPMMKNDEK